MILCNWGWFETNVAARQGSGDRHSKVHKSGEQAVVSHFLLWHVTCDAWSSILLLPLSALSPSVLRDASAIGTFPYQVRFPFCSTLIVYIAEDMDDPSEG